MQGKQVDAMVELSKICLLLRIFPPEESSVCIFNVNLQFFPIKLAHLPWMNTLFIRASPVLVLRLILKVKNCS